MHQKIIINATHLGTRINGIGTYIINLLSQWTQDSGGIFFDVYLHENARPHLGAMHFPENFALHWIRSSLFPDTANLRRFLFSNYLAALRSSSVIFNPSQLEMTFFGAREIITVQDLIPIQVQDHYQRKQSLYHRFLVPRGLANAAAIIAPSVATQRALHSFYGVPPDRVNVVPYGVRTFAPRTKAPPNRKYILFAGRMVPYRNINTLIRAFGQIQHLIEHDLVLAGEICCDLHLPEPHDRISIRGYVDEAELTALYYGASAFVFPSSAEGFGFPPLEAMACGCPVVTTAEASLPEVCQNAALIVDPRSEESIAGALLEILSNEPLRERLIEDGYRRVSELTWRTSAQAHLRVFDRVLNN